MTQRRVLYRSPSVAAGRGPQRAALERSPVIHPLALVHRIAGNAALSQLAGHAPWLGGRGQPLPPAQRDQMEARLGLDLSAVRVHLGPEAAASARALQARAYTMGRDIVFAPGEFRPAAPAGRRLLAHELVHVAQQSRGGTAAIQRQPQPDEPEWQRQLDDILPRHVGLVTHIMRMQQLFDRFTEVELRDLAALIHANAAARRLTHDHGVPGIFALQETRVGDRLDVEAARILLITFPTRRRQPRASMESRPEVFPEDVVRDAYIRFHYNALLPRTEGDFAPDLPRQIRRNCIAIVHDMMPRLFTDPGVVRRMHQRLAQLRRRSVTHTMVHTGTAMTSLGVAHRPIEIRFKDAGGRTTNGNTEPTEMVVDSAWDLIMAAVGDVHGWHIFGMSVMDGHHSVTVFVDNQPEGRRLYWADQWFIDQDFQHMPGAISGFREYDRQGFDGWIAQLTNRMWNSVHSPTSDCANRARRRSRDWDTVCRYDATLSIWHLRRVASPGSRTP